MRAFNGLRAAAVFALSLVFSVPAPAQDISREQNFSADDLLAPPAQSWITNGGTILNQRYSPLEALNPDTIGSLKGVWRTSLMGSGVGPNYSAQGQPIVHEGVIYISTGQSDVFAVSVDTGEILWSYLSGITPEQVRLCCGWINRGVAIGEGKVFFGRLDAKLVALDMATGEVAWEIQAEDPMEGFSITSAPLFYDGLVITGFGGGEFGIRGRVKAYDAGTGELVWTFYTIPGPGEVGHETWPADNDAWMYGGAPVWQTPAVDPELGLIYFSTGNAGPDLNGSFRAGDNLFSVSVVALDVRTGEYRWHFQQVRHDIWDYDSPNPVILFDAEYDGVMRKGLAQVSKTGWVYILDRETGEPLVGIEDRPVPQSEMQATAATQPYPIGDAIVPQHVDIPLAGVTLINEGRIFTPFEQDVVLFKPWSMGGANWMPSSYDPERHLMYVCANDVMGGASGGDPEYPIDPDPAPNQYLGGAFTRNPAVSRGIFAAVDVRTNTIAWRQQWDDRCWSGSVATAGGLVFVGRNDGRLLALDSDTGAEVWSFQTDAGVSATITPFERDGETYVALLSGGSFFMRSKRADSLWLFSLNGTLESLPPGSAGVVAAAAAAPAVTPPEGRVADLVRGAEIYGQACLACHGQDGTGGHGGGAPLTDTALDLSGAMTVAASGRNAMPAFSTVLTREDLHDVAGYILQELKAE